MLLFYATNKKMILGNVYIYIYIFCLPMMEVGVDTDLYF